MDYSINSRPLLDPSEQSDFEDSYVDDNNDNCYNENEENTDVRLIKRAHLPPSDTYNYSYIIFYLLGMTTLIPWNFLMTAEDYWMYKFRNVTSNSTDVLTPIQAKFTSDLSVSSAVPNTLFLVLNAFLSYRIPLAIRMIGSMTIVFILFIVTTIFVEVDTDQWQHTFLIITLGTVIVMNSASAIAGGGLFGIAGQFPSEYMTAVVSGQALGGIFAALVEIISLTFGAPPKITAFIYFMVGNAALLIALVCYTIMAKTKFFKYYVYEKLAIMKANENDEIVVSNIGRCSVEPNFYTVLNKIWVYGFAEWLVFVTTLSVYPAVTVLITSQYKGNGHLWNDTYFIPVVNYLIFNSGDYLGRILAGMLKWPRNRPYIIAFFALARVAFIPLLLMCNANPRHNLPTLIHSDIIYIALMCVFSFTNGYIANISLIWAPKIVSDHEKEMASSTMAAFLGIGLAFGSSLSLILVEIL